MNSRTLILSLGLIVFSSSAFAQVAPQKGYYAIYNNAKKLSSNNNDNLKKSGPSQTTHVLTVAKGYYSIKNNYDKLFPAGTDTNTSKTKSAPVVTKGYYLIGMNKEKLKR